MNPFKDLIKRWAREETIAVIDEQIQAKQDTCGHWVSATWRESVLYCDACNKILNVLDAETGAEREDRSSIDRRYIDKVIHDKVNP